VVIITSGVIFTGGVVNPTDVDFTNCTGEPNSAGFTDEYTFTVPSPCDPIMVLTKETPLPDAYTGR
jgi:hypothetical protein